MRRTTLSAALAAALAVVPVAACSGSDDGPGAGGPAPGGTAGGTPAPPRSTSEPSEPLPVLDSRETSGSGASRAVPLRIELNQLQRRDDLLVLNLTVINLSPEGESNWQVNTFFDDVDLTQPDFQQTTADGITLLDTANSKRHLVARDSEGNCVCTSGLSGTFLAAGERLGLTATFAAPPAGTETMDVLVPGVGTFPAVPVS